MLTLQTSRAEFRGSFQSRNRFVVRITDQLDRPRGVRAREALLLAAESSGNPDGFRLHLLLRSNAKDDRMSEGAPTVVLPDEFSYLAAGDILSVEPQRSRVRTLFRRRSPHNSFLVTERCNHYCLMCSQPPRNVDDGWLVGEIVEAIKLIDQDTNQIGLTGGEPTLLGDGFFEIVRTAESYLPRTAVHVLSNGRAFADPAFVDAYAAIGHHDLMVGIPLYSDVSTVHDYVVQSDGAYDETIRGILNLKQRRQRVELRIVIHKQTYSRLPQLAEFIARNLTFVDQVSLMGLEMTGFTLANLDVLWIDPIEYQHKLSEAVSILSALGMNVLIFNHQLCLLDRGLWKYAVKAISDWKNEYMPECNGCAVMNQCGGFFSSAKLRYSDHISPVT